MQPFQLQVSALAERRVVTERCLIRPATVDPQETVAEIESGQSWDSAHLID
ncbi:hypothetical protein [Paraburkholderia diazotrophica]|uniref:Uncharacterized protein n=1 Tax=Paraburkholderia diazotrophica TaxID=667676 RepID=A0A1H7EMJ3_9BURK|nr:hypothetical protein [Paraburkholderia diazotrophica]SEK13252.1 hypothetical protein SAMN05192539_106512 [Paraburkholderia diazotrophica]